jgi:hypothetical protein
VRGILRVVLRTVLLALPSAAAAQPVDLRVEAIKELQRRLVTGEGFVTQEDRQSACELTLREINRVLRQAAGPFGYEVTMRIYTDVPTDEDFTTVSCEMNAATSLSITSDNVGKK